MKIPLLAHRRGLLSFSYLSDTYGSYSAHGMYGNHASLNYVFGNVGTTTHGPSRVFLIWFLLH